ncbi:MAG: hypothetical protein AB3N23_16090 [Paracoccaceae bacterium]
MLPKYHPVVLFLTMAPLYLGPLLSGLMGPSIPTVLGLAGIFLLAQLAAGKHKGRGEMPLVPFLAAIAGAQLLAVTVVFGAGTLLRLLFGAVSLPGWVPFASTAFGAVLFAWRYRYDPAEAELTEALDDAISEIERMTPPDESDTHGPDR